MNNTIKYLEDMRDALPIMIKLGAINQSALKTLEESISECIELSRLQHREILIDFLEHCDAAGWIKNIDKKRVIEDYIKSNESK